MTAATAIFEALGGQSVLRGARPHRAGRAGPAGLPYAALEPVGRQLGLSREQVAEALHLPERTPARRKAGTREVEEVPRRIEHGVVA